ncbi:transmembrane amino acid efflux protein [Caenispirillum salinarum AK4]|uniref:Transmembrane amino acid efflux protein n=1 Tax=Caenispirillum salinarum AK4 TaxID=1238182 RepID=K9HG29_9PROT|nr:LysE family translocator [Caenispirillum salinarum]EKV27581.1 transmembrane amino acid efflux protein [Caenispirillum salinarum AK4]
MLDSLLPVAPHTLALFVAASLAMNVTPGPDMMYVLANGLRGGLRGGIAANLGITFGAAGHVMLAALGLTALVAAAPVALDAVRIAGALYLLWLGWKALTGPSPLGGAMADTAEAAGRGERKGRVVRDGFVTCLLNPKVGLFFVAFLPQFVDRSATADPVTAQILFLGGTFLLTSFVTLAPVAAAGGAMTRLLRRLPWAAGALGKVSGVIFIGLAVRLLVMDSRTGQ